MPKRQNSADDSAKLRGRAEARLRDQKERVTPSVDRKSEADTQRQLHELEVHQIELEMQNEELIEARDKMEALSEKYTDLYDFAPVGYLTLDQAGCISETNLAASVFLGEARSALVNRRFGPFHGDPSRPKFPRLAMGYCPQSTQSEEIRIADSSSRSRPACHKAWPIQQQKSAMVGRHIGGLHHPAHTVVKPFWFNTRCTVSPKVRAVLGLISISWKPISRTFSDVITPL